ncbi:MAG TPA: ABC transporter permease subunit [Flavitalea sp.]|nr:ABC transporter permease subunit [Flavitalea sp.]
MNVKHWFKPFEKVGRNHRLVISAVWIVLLLLSWIVSTSGTKHLFPTPGQVWEGFVSLYNEGLVVHIGSSLGLCFQAALISIVFSLLIVYLSPLPAIKPIAVALSRIRYLPLTGITFYLAILVTDARSMQVGVLVIFMSLYFITSLLGVLKDIPAEEIDHARSLKCSRWEVLVEVVIKGRMDYVLDVLRQNLAIIWMMLVTVESILVAAGGLGVLIKNSDKFMNHGRIVALQLVILLVGLLLDWLLNVSRKSLFRYSTF